MRLERTMAAVIAAGLLTGSGLSAAASESKKPPAESAEKPPPQPGAQIFNPWRAAGPRPEHLVLAGLVGKASTATHLEIGPLPRGKDGQGTAEAKLVMGGLFVEVTQSGIRMKESFDRIMLYGFDPAIGKYTADVIDTTSPAIVRYIGTYDAAKKQLDLTARYSEPNTRRYVTARLVTTFVDDKTWTYEEFLAPGQDKPEGKIQTVTFKRG